MRAGCKENAMTVAERKRQACQDDDGEAFYVMQSLKKAKVLEPLQASVQQAGPVAASHESNNGGSISKALKKRSRLESQEGSTSPAAGKRGKRADGSSSTALSPRASAAAIEELLTCEGLEKDPDLEVQHAYISRQLQQQQRVGRHARPPAQQPGGAPSSSASSGARVSGAPASVADTAGPGRNEEVQKDAAKGSRGRDQAQHSSRDQQPLNRSRAVQTPVRPRNPILEDEQDDEPRVHLDIVGDKEWQRLFAVLTLHHPSEEQQQHQGGSSTAAATGAAAAVGGAAAAPSATQVAPATPKRRDSGLHAAAAPGSTAAVDPMTPTRRSFLATEFTRVQARLTPERHQQAQGSAMVMC